MGLSIHKLETGSRAHQDGRLHVGDRIKEVMVQALPALSMPGLLGDCI